MIRLADKWFDAAFYGEIKESPESWRVHHEDGTPMTFGEAQGLFLWCPCGYGQTEKDGTLKYPLDLSLNHGRSHGLMIPFSNPPSGVPVPVNHGPLSRDGSHRPRWMVVGSSLDDLSLTPSIAVGKDPECWHGYITNGEAR